MKFFKIALVLFSVPALGQVTIGNNVGVIFGNTAVSSNMDWNNAGSLNSTFGNEFVFTSSQSFATQTSTSFYSLKFKGQGDKQLNGEFNVAGALTLSGGLLYISEDSQFTITSSGQIVTYNENDSWIVGRIWHEGSGKKFFPIGTSTLYAPVELDAISGSEETRTSLAYSGASNNSSGLPDNIVEVSPEHSWSFQSENFNGSQVNVPVLPADEFLVSGENRTGAVVEVSEGTIRSLDGFGSRIDVLPSLLSVGFLQAPSSSILLGAKVIFIPIIHNIITPNGDLSNDYLIIDALSKYEDDNEVILMDRYGSIVYQKRNFRNFNNSDNPYDGSLNFLSPGNYICILKYGSATVKKVITVLK